MEWKDQVLTELERYLIKNGMETEPAEAMVHFVIKNIGDREEWKALGQISFVPYMATGEEEILQIFLAAAKNVDLALKEVLSVKIMELNRAATFGHLGMDEQGLIFYQYRLPVVGKNLELVRKAFELVVYEMFTFLDAFYADILVIINKPDKLTLSRYMELMLMEEE